MLNQQSVRTLLLGVFVWAFTGIGVSAQSNFLYLQSENNKAYTIQLRGSSYSSNAKGYLLIPDMRNGEYSMIVNFTGDEYPEYTYNFKIEDKPKGYALKITQESEWVLMDMVSLEIIKGSSSEFVPIKSNGKQIQKIMERISENGVDQVYRVRNGYATDTVVLFVPALPIMAAPPVQRVSAPAPKIKEPAAVPSPKTPAPLTTPKLPAAIPVQKTPVTAAPPPSQKTPVTQAPPLPKSAVPLKPPVDKTKPPVKQ